MIKPENQQVLGAFNEMVTVSIDASRVATIWLDMPGKSVNTLRPEMFQALDDAIALIEREGCAGVIVASSKARCFVAGADLYALAKMGYGRGPELASAWALLESKRTADGSYLLDWTPPLSYLKGGRRAAPSKWVTFYALLAKKHRDGV